MALPLAGGGTAIEVEGELISKPYVDDHAEHDAPLRRRGDARRLEVASTCRAGATSRPGKSASRATPPRRRTSSPPGAIGGGPVRVDGVGRGQHPGRRALRRGARSRWARQVEMRRRLDRGVLGAASCKPIDVDLNHIPDAAMTAAVVALFAERPEHDPQHRQLAGEGDRPHRRDGDGAAQARRAGRGGRRLPPRSRRPRS